MSIAGGTDDDHVRSPEELHLYSARLERDSPSALRPFNSRQAVFDTTLPTGGGEDGKSHVFLLKGTEVNFSSHVLQRRHHLWGPDTYESVLPWWEKKWPGWEYVPFPQEPFLYANKK